MTSLAELGRLGPLSPAELAAALSGEGLRQLFVKSALLLAYIDGKVTALNAPRSRPMVPPWASRRIAKRPSKNPCATT